MPPVQVPFSVTTDGTLALAALQKTLSEIQDTYRARLTLPLLHQLQEMHTRAAAFAQPDDATVCYVEYSGIRAGLGLSHLSLCAVPRDLPRQLYDLLWAAGKTGRLDLRHRWRPAASPRHGVSWGWRGGTPVRTLQVPSPFDYPHNSLLVFPPPSPGRQKKQTSHERVARQIGQLIRAAHGHTLVLFTSYDQMGHVYEQLQGRLPVPLFKAPRGGQRFVEQFKTVPQRRAAGGRPLLGRCGFPRRWGLAAGDRAAAGFLYPTRYGGPAGTIPRSAHLHTSRNCARNAAKTAAGLRPRHPHRDRQLCGSPSWTRGQRTAGGTTGLCWTRCPPVSRSTTNIEDIQTFLRARKSPDFFLPDFENDSKQTDSKTNTK